MATSLEELTNGLPAQIQEYFKYVWNLEFDEKPDYQYLRRLIKEIMVSRNEEIDPYFDWLKKKMQIKIQPSAYADYVSPSKPEKKSSKYLAVI